MDPQVAALIQMMQAQAAARPAPAMTEQDPATARAGADATFEAFNQPMPASVGVVDTAIPGPAGELPAKVFTPAGDGPFPLLVYFHGGGWVIGNPNTHRKLCAELAEAADVVVVSVDYRLAPEHPAPAPLDDCVAATRWIVENANSFGADGTRFAIGGDSAGASLALATAMALRDSGGPEARLLLLLYGTFDLALDKQSQQVNKDGPILTLDTMQWFKDHYLSGGVGEDEPGVSPLRGNLAGLPPAHLIVGTLDPLLDDSKLVAEKIQQAGGKATLSIYQDMPHIFLQLTALLDGAKKGLAEASTALRGALSA